MVVEAVISTFAERQHGVVTREQLLAAGVTPAAIKHRVRRGLLTPLHRGVYRLGPVHSPLTSPAAAVLACGPTAALSHHAAAALHGIRKARPGPIDVTVTTGNRERPGIRVHRTHSIETEIVRGIPTTTITRTLLDLAAEIPPRDLQRAIDEAQIQRKLDHLSLVDAVGNAAGHRGARALRAAARNMTEARVTRSEAERALRDLVRTAGLDEPEMNVKIGRWEVDALWRDADLIVEVDGYAFHSTRFAFERDRRKDAELRDLGFEVMRVTWRQLHAERELLVARLTRRLLSGARRGRGRPLAAAGLPGFPLDRPRP